MLRITLVSCHRHPRNHVWHKMYSTEFYGLTWSMISPIFLMYLANKFSQHSLVIFKLEIKLEVGYTRVSSISQHCLSWMGNRKDITTRVPSILKRIV